MKETVSMLVSFLKMKKLTEGGSSDIINFGQIWITILLQNTEQLLRRKYFLILLANKWQLKETHRQIFRVLGGIQLIS